MLLAKENFKFYTWAQKCYFGIIEKIANMALLNPCMIFEKKKLAKSILLKHYQNGNMKNIHNMSQGLPNRGFIQEKAQKGDFLPFFFKVGSQTFRNDYKISMSQPQNSTSIVF